MGKEIGSFKRKNGTNRFRNEKLICRAISKRYG